MKKIFLFLITTIVFIGCEVLKDKNKEKGYPLAYITDFDSLKRPADKKTLYFPISEFNYYKGGKTESLMESIIAQMSTRVLYLLEEPIFAAKYWGFDSYRIVDYNLKPPKVIRMDKIEDSIRVTIKHGESDGPFGNIKYSKNKIFKINICFWDSLEALANNARLWNTLEIKNYGWTDPSYFFEAQSKTGYTILSFSRISKKYNYEGVVNFRRLFERIELLSNAKK